MEMSADNANPFYKRIIISEEKKTDVRCLTLQTIKNWGLAKTNFFGKLKGDNLISTGYLSEVNYEKMLEKAVEFFNTVFTKIEEDLNIQWDLGSGEGGFIGMNIGVSALIRTLDSIIEYLFKFKGLAPESLTGEELAFATWEYLDPVVRFVKSLDSEETKKLRSLFGSGATGKVVREFQNAIHQDFEEFKPEGLEQWIKESSGKYNTRAYELGHNQIEPMIDAFIKSKLAKEFGKKYWWNKGVPPEIQKKCATARIDKGSTEPDSNFLNTMHYIEIIEKQWTLLGNHFTPPGFGSEKKPKRLQWLNKFNSIRQKYSHPQRENTTEEEYNFLEETKEWLEISLRG
jgi:DNA sulfur modification protein DndB